MYKWVINEPDKDISDRLARDAQVPPFIARLLVSRGITTRESADIFFNSNEFSDPFDIKDMDKAVAAINEAVDNGSRITVYGDYDADGITSTYILFSYLEALGAEVGWYIPTRDEGYGLNKPAIDLMKKQGTQLIITVDNGISAIEEAEYIKELGMKLVITDHHQVPEQLPYAEAVVNPHRRDDISQYKNLAGCGVVLKLIMAMEGDSEQALMQFGDIAAVGTVGDLVKLDGENRIIVREGLRLMENTENMGLNRLLEKSGIEQGSEIRSVDLSFSVCPRINAAGRCGSPSTAMELLLAPSMNTAAAKAEELCELNDSRKEKEAEIVASAEELIRSDPSLLERKVLILCGSWPHGIIGIASSKLVHKYGKPNIIITKEGDTSRGSIRSTDDLNVCDLLNACSDMLIRFGGHTKAAGFTIETSRIPEFMDAVYAYTGENVRASCSETLTADMEIFPEELNVSNVDLMDNLKPFGEGNRLPLFFMRGFVIKSKKPVKEGRMVSLEADFGGSNVRMLCPGISYAAFPYREGDRADAVVKLDINEYNGRRSVNVYVSDIRYSEFSQDRYFAAAAAYEDYRFGRVDRRLLCRMEPDMAEFRSVYDIIRGCSESLSRAEITTLRSGINDCKFRVILDIFREFGLVSTDVTKDTVRLMPVSGKVDIESSKVIARLRSTANS